MELFDFFKSRKEATKKAATEASNRNGVGDTPLNAKYTPELIVELGPRDIFVFGSNLYGHHAGGAARAAVSLFGAVWGQGEGLQGNSYAIPTMQGGVETIKPYIDRFIEFAEYEKALTFYVTKIGCGIAGFSVKDIAPLFRNAYNLPNVILPKEFAEVIEEEMRSPRHRSNDICESGHIHDSQAAKSKEGDAKDAAADNTRCCEVTTHCYGMTRTFADIILGLNEEKQYTSPEQALSDLDKYLRRFREQGDDIAYLSVRVLLCFLLGKAELFEGGVLNATRLRELIFEEQNFLPAYDMAYDSYCREKLINLIAYLNEFRRYSTPEELRRDLFEKTDVLSFSACEPITGFYYFMMSAYYPRHFFIRAIRELWDEITTDGILDAQKMRQVMFENHMESVGNFGLETTISRDFLSDSLCHPEVFVPKKKGTAPIYVKDGKTGRYIRSCGEGKGPNSVPDWLEFQIAKRILVKDKSYKYIRGYYIPKYDNTLPVYGEYRGRLVFDTQDEKLKFIEDIKSGK